MINSFAKRFLCAVLVLAVSVGFAPVTYAAQKSVYELVEERGDLKNVGLPEEESILDEYEIKHVKSKLGHAIYSFCDSGGQYKRSHNVLEGTEVLVLAREGLFSFCLYETGSGLEKAGWLITECLVDDYGGAKKAEEKEQEKEQEQENDPDRGTDYHRVYAEALYQGVELGYPGSKSGKMPAEYYYLFDMDGNGVEELILLGNDGPVWSFAVYTVKNGGIICLADSFSKNADITSCDITEWRDATVEISVLDGCKLYAEAEKGGEGCYYMFSYDGNKVKLKENAPRKCSSSVILVLESELNWAAELYSDEDIFGEYYYMIEQESKTYTGAFTGDGKYEYATANGCRFNSDVCSFYVFSEGNPPSYWDDYGLENNFAKIYELGGMGFEYAEISGISPKGGGKYLLKCRDIHDGDEYSELVSDAKCVIEYGECVYLYLADDCKFYVNTNQGKKQISRQDATERAKDSGEYFEMNVVVKNGELKEVLFL